MDFDISNLDFSKPVERISYASYNSKGVVFLNAPFILRQIYQDSIDLEFVSENEKMYKIVNIISECIPIVVLNNSSSWFGKMLKADFVKNNFKNALRLPETIGGGTLINVQFDKLEITEDSKKIRISNLKKYLNAKVLVDIKFIGVEFQKNSYMSKYSTDRMEIISEVEECYFDVSNGELLEDSEQE